jgi:hypothetical protein
VQPGITGDDFPGAAGGGIALADGGDVFAKSVEHGGISIVGRSARASVQRKPKARNAQSLYRLSPFFADCRTSAKSSLDAPDGSAVVAIGQTGARAF